MVASIVCKECKIGVCGFFGWGGVGGKEGKKIQREERRAINDYVVPVRFCKWLTGLVLNGRLDFSPAIWIS